LTGHAKTQQKHAAWASDFSSPRRRIVSRAAQILTGLADGVDVLVSELEAAQKERDELLEAREFLPTSNIDLLHDTLMERGFTDFAASIATFLGSTGAAYSALAYQEEKERADRLEAALERIANYDIAAQLGPPILQMQAIARAAVSATPTPTKENA
jgi:hypothetical protein